MRAIACTGNPHKVEELAALLPALTFEPLAPDVVLPPEVGETFLDNARIKAHAGAALHPGTWVLADDSGIIVDALDGEPGVRSARFAGEDASDEENVRLLLKRLRDVPPHERTARFACVLVAVAPDGEELHATGFVEGHVAGAPAGDAGFGYDPVFVPEGHALTFAQLGDEVKATMSHRARAARLLDEQLVVRR